jgi:hypothetical protein
VSYSSEPYAQYVDDLLTALTGGMIRTEFRFLPEQAPYRLAAPGPILPGTIRVFGQTDGSYRRFQSRIDYTISPELTIEWNARPDGSPAPDAQWPDLGSTFYANFDYVAPASAAPLLTDRNPGGITRLLAESFGREYAVFSRQLEAVYQAAYLDTAASRDLDQLVALVGLTRRRGNHASGVVLFGRSTPSTADIFIPAGTRVSTAEPPAVVFETVEDRTLPRGGLSIEAPIHALVPDAQGVVAAQAIAVIHRPILGIETVANPQPTRFSGRTEDDESLRARARRALERTGRATTGALIGALTSLPGLREKDVRLSDDPLAHPGVVELSVALPAMSDEDRQRTVEQALTLIEETRPVGIRILTNIDAPRPAGAATPGSGIVPAEADVPASVGATLQAEDLFLPVDVNAVITPTTLSLSAQERNELKRRTEKVVTDFLAEAGIGEILVYNRLVALLMDVDGVLDVAVEMFPQTDPSQPRRKNLVPDNPAVRPVAGAIDVQIGGALVMLDVTVTVVLKGPGLLGDRTTALSAARTAIESEIRDGLRTFAAPALSVDSVKSLVHGSNSYDVNSLHYKVEYVESGVRIHQQDLQLPLTGLEQPWLRRVTVEDGGGS